MISASRASVFGSASENLSAFAFLSCAKRGKDFGERLAGELTRGGRDQVDLRMRQKQAHQFFARHSRMRPPPPSSPAAASPLESFTTRNAYYVSARLQRTICVRRISSPLPMLTQAAQPHYIARRRPIHLRLSFGFTAIEIALP